MATPIIRSNGSSSGVVTGEGRKDLVIGETVTLTDAELANVGSSYVWVFLDKPISSTAILSGAATPTAIFSPDISGSYYIKCIVNGISSSEVIIAVALTYTDARIPAFGEALEYNESGNTKGWHTDQTAFMRQTDSGLVTVNANSTKIKITTSDTTPGFLWDKLAEGDGVTLTKQNAGANENIKISSVGGLVKVNSSDTTADYLATKLVEGQSIDLVVSTAPGAKTLTVKFSGEVPVSSGDTTPNYLVSKILEGTGITVTKENVGANEDLKIASKGFTTVSSGDTTPDYLLNKFVAGTNITLTKGSPGGDETITIAASGVGASTNKFTTPIQLGNNQSSYYATPLIIGMQEINPSDFTVANCTMSAVFRATGLMGNSGITGYVRLTNLTDSETVATLTFSSTSISTQSSTLTIGSSSGNLKNSSKKYEVTIWVDSPSSSSDSIQLGVVEIQIINTVN